MNYICKDYISDIIDEIALEGLDGITLQGLWLRLLDRPNFMFKPIDDRTKSFLWRIITSLSNVSFYSLPIERGDLILYKREEHIDATGNFYEPSDYICIYPHAPVEDNGIMGSCSTYKERVDITSLVRKEAYEKVILRGNKLIIVANQNARSRALYSVDFNPCTELNAMQYCILERIGRARYEGEVTQGNRGLRTVTTDPKLLYYFRKVLVKNKLVSKQVFYMKIAKQTLTGSLIHLLRFFKEIRTRQDTDAIKLKSYLLTVPHNSVPMKSIKSSLNIELKKLLLKYPRNFKTFQVPYRTINPNSKPTDWKLKSSGEEKSVRVVKLVNPNLENDEDEEDDEEENSLLIESQSTGGGSLKKLAYDIVESVGPRGIKQTAMGNVLAVPSLQARSICKRLLDKSKCIQTALMDIGRQRTTHFYCSKFNSSKSSITAEITEEKEKLLQAISLNTELVDENSSTNDTVCNNTKLNETDCSLSVIDGQENSDNSRALVEEPNKSFITSDNIKAEIIICKQDMDNTTTGIKEELMKEEERKRPSNSVTARILRRASLIVQAVNLHKVIQDTQKVHRIITDVEESEGLTQTIDRKTIQRLLHKLESDGLIRTIKVNLKGYGKEKTMLFICHPSVNETHSEIQSAIEQAKMKLPIVSAHHTKKNSKKKNKIASYKYDITAGRKYGYKPKFIRMRILHSYMYYLIYGYDGSGTLDQSCKKDIVEKLGVDKSVLEEMSFVYRTELDWKMFLPPLPTHTEYPEGWCLLSDVLLRLPLYLFVSIVNVPFDIPGLFEYVQHPIKKYFLVKHLPSEILHHLTLMRKYIFVISDIVSRLGYIGLIQMGPQKLKEKDQVFIYLNRHALLLNTTQSDVGYNHISSNKIYESIHYTFNTADDTEHYWYDLWNFAMNTNLGARNSMTGKPVVVESVSTKKELLAAIQPKSPDEVKLCDVGFLPGDNLGAAGLDSDMFVHLKRNWYWTGEKANGSVDQKTFLYPPTMKRGSRILNLKSTSTAQSTVSKIVKPPMIKESKINPEISKSKISRVGNVSWKSRAVSKKITRILRQRKQKYTRKPYYDQKDKDALSRMVKLRVDWSPMEDNLLLICKVASLYMSPDKRRQIAKNFSAVREILHTTYPTISRNKTSRACQRRIHYMMRNPSTAQSVYLCLEEIKQDPEITSKFHRAVEKLDASIKSQGEGPKGYQKEYDKILENLVLTLMKKLKKITCTESAFCDIHLPNTVAEFERKYAIVTPKQVSLRYGSFNEVQKTLDISASVINSVIHSSLCSTTDKTSYSQQLFYIYQQYPDKLLRYVMAKCRSMSIVSCRKRYKRWKSAGNDCLPLASSPYQLSITYVHILQAKYQYNIFSECYNSFKRLISNTLISSPVEIADKPSSVYRMKVEVNAGGECANIVELFSSGLIEMNVKFPDQLIVLDPRLSETEESYKLIMKRFKELLNIIKDSRKKDKKSVLDDEEEDDEDIEDDQDKNEDDDKDPYFEQFNLKNKTGVANTASRLALYLMRDEPLEQLDNSLQHAHDYFVLNPCAVTVDLDKGNAEQVVNFKDVKAKVLADIKRTATFPGVKRDHQEIIGEIDSFPGEFIQSFLEYLKSKGDLGATYNNIMEEFPDCEKVMDLLSELVERQFVLKSGVVDVRFIHNTFSKTWLVKSYYILRHTRDSMDCQNTQSAYAISFKGGDSSLKRKAKGSDGESQKDTANELGSENELSSPLRKKLKASSPGKECNTNQLMTTTSVPEETSSKENTSDCNSPATKRIKLEEDALNNLEHNEGTKNEINSNAEQASTSCQNTDHVTTRSSDKQVENEQSRVLVKTMKKRWVPVRSENMKKFGSIDTMEAEKVFVKVRPWIKIDGTLNRRVLDRLLGSVLGQCLTYPGISLKRLQDKFTPALQPTHTFELLEILQKIDCVKLIKLKKSWKCSLFSKRHTISTHESTAIGDTTDVVVEPDQLAICRLGYFIGEKNYSVDYLDALMDPKQ